MILDACGQRSNGGKDAEGLARAESREGSGKWEVGRVDRKEGGWGGGIWKGATGRGDGEESNRDGKRVAMGGIQREEEMERGAVGKGGEDGNGEGGKGKTWGWGGGGEEGARGGKISQMDMMGCLGGHRL